MSRTHTRTRTCENCKQPKEELCGDGFCRDCHVSLSFEDCVSGAWLERQLQKNRQGLNIPVEADK